MKLTVTVKAKQGSLQFFKAEAHRYGVCTALERGVAVTYIVVAVKRKNFGIHKKHPYEIYYQGVPDITKKAACCADGKTISDLCAQEDRESSVRG